MDVPETRFAITDDDVRIAYHDFGRGPPVVFVGSLFSHVEGNWDFVLMRRMWERMAANVRVLMFDHRGTGMSDGFPEPPSLQDRALDVKAVLDTAGIDRSALLGWDFGAQVAIRFAVDLPDRVERLVLANSRVGSSAEERADELNPDGATSIASSTREARPDQTDTIGIDMADESEPDPWVELNPSIAKYPDERRLRAAWERKVGSRDVWRRQIESVVPIDVTDLAPTVVAPTLITQTAGSRMFHVGYSRVLAELIRGSDLIEFEGEDHHYWIGDNWRDIIDSHVRFITGAEVDVPAERAFAVVLFTDIVESTRASLATGDTEWRRQLDTHDRISDQIVLAHGGRVVKSTGDGILAVFDAPSRAVDAAVQLRDELSAADIAIRAGLHGGEIETRGDDVSGAVVNLAARVEQTAVDGDIQATKTIRDMLLGSAHRFELVGVTALKGFDGDWSLYRVGSETPER